MPKLVRLYIRHTIIGFGVSAVFVALLFWFDVVGLWHLVTHTDGGWLAAALLVVFNGIVFSGAQFGIAIMGMAEPANKDSDRDGGGCAPEFAAIPVPARVPHVQRRR